MVGRYEILIPVAGNDGIRFDAETVKIFDALALDTFGGFTHIPTEIRGVWQDPDTGIIYDEAMTMYYVYSDDEGAVLTLAGNAATIFDQVAISVTKPGGYSVLVYNASLREAVA